MSTCYSAAQKTLRSEELLFAHNIRLVNPILLATMNRFQSYRSFATPQRFEPPPLTVIISSVRLSQLLRCWTDVSSDHIEPTSVIRREWLDVQNPSGSIGQLRLYLHITLTGWTVLARLDLTPLSARYFWGLLSASCKSFCIDVDHVADSYEQASLGLCPLRW